MFVYAERALGPFWGFLAGLVQIVEFVFAPPAIALAIGAYVQMQFGLDSSYIKLIAVLVFLILLNVFLLLLGMILDIFSAIVIMVPIVLPIAIGYGIDPVHLGIIFLANMQIGYITPPVGRNLFIASHRFDRSVLEVYRATLPFFIILLISVLLITYIPAISLLLVGRGD